MRLKITTVLSIALLAWAAGPAYAADAVKCKDANGKVYYSDKPSPECGKTATEKVSPAGIKRPGDPGERTPQQRAEDEAKEKAKLAEQKRVLECQRHNKSVIITYNSPEDIDKARAKELQQAEAAIRGIQQKIADIQQQQAELQKQVGDYKGKKIPAQLKESVDGAEKELRTNQGLVLSTRKELDGIRTRFDETKRVYTELTTNPTGPTATCQIGAAAK